MKKILGLSIGIVLIIGLVVGGTFAYFSDTETITVTDLTAGTIDLEIDSTGTLVYAAEVNDLKPCETGYLVITLTNAGTNDMDIWKLITVDSTTEGALPEPEQAWYAANLPTGGDKNDIDRYIHFDMWIEKNATPTVFDTGDIMLIAESVGWLLSDNLDDYTGFDPAVINTTDNGVAGYYMYLGTLAPLAEMVIVQSFHLDGSVDNWAQGDCLTFTETLFAQQTVGDAPSPAPELPGLAKS